MALSMASKLLRIAASPFIFRVVRMHHYWSPDAVQHLLALQNIHRHIRSFIFLPQGNIQDWRSTTAESIAQCAFLLTTLWSSLPHMESLSFEPHVPHPLRPLTALDVIRCSALTLPAVRTLRISDDAVFMWECCPLVDSISIDSVAEALDWPQSTLVTKLAIRCIDGDLGNELPLLQAIGERLPCLQSLTIEQGFVNVEDLFAALRGSRLRLVTLALPSLSDLDVGYSPPQCGFGWSQMDQSAREQLRQAKKLGMDRVRAAALAAFPRLKYLWVGECEVFDFTQVQPCTPDSALPSAQSGIDVSGMGLGEQLDHLEPICVSVFPFVGRH